MRLIEDVKSDLRALDRSDEALMKFGRTVGGVFLMIATVIFIIRSATPAFIVTALVGTVLAFAGMAAPRMLRTVHLVWMGMAFVLGWFVSRLVLAVFFFLIITPVAFAARMAGKKFLDTEFGKGASTYWIEKKDHVRYDRMW
ncbi:MAG: SxtJ family membrane protein [Acidobacteriota bacterium]